MPILYFFLLFNSSRNVMEAMEWLLEQGSLEDTADDSIVGVNSGGGSQGENVAIDHVTSANSTVRDYPQDPAERVLTTFLQYRKKWFQVSFHFSIIYWCVYVV